MLRVYQEIWGSGESKIPNTNGEELHRRPYNSCRKLFDRVAFRILPNINGEAPQWKYAEWLLVIGLMVAMLMVFFTYDELGLVLYKVGPILSNGCGRRGKNYVALFQGSKMSAGQHFRNFILGIQCCRLFILIVYQWPDQHNNRVWSRRSEIALLCYLVYVKKIWKYISWHWTCQTQNLNYIARVNFAACTNYSTHALFFSEQRLRSCIIL